MQSARLSRYLAREISDKDGLVYFVLCQSSIFSTTYLAGTIFNPISAVCIVGTLIIKLHEIFNVYLVPLSRKPLANGLWSIFI